MAFLYKNGRNYHVQLYVAGRRRRFSLKTDNYGLARDKVRRMEAELISGDLERPTRTPVAEAVMRFAEAARARCRPGSSSVGTDLYRLREFFGSDAVDPGRPYRVRRGLRAVHAGRGEQRRRGKKVCEFAVRVAFIEEVSGDMVAGFLVRIQRARGLSPKTVNEYREVVQRFYSWAIRTGGARMFRGLRTNPCEAVPKLKVPAGTIRFLRLEEIAQQLEGLKGQPALRAAVAVCVYAGLRREEALWLTREDVDLQKRVIHVRAKTIDGRQWWPKTGRNRVVPISRALLAIVQEYQPAGSSPWYFPSPRGCLWDVNNFSHTLAKSNKSLGLPWACLDYRHTFGSQLAMRGESLYKISELMGNSPEICRRHYACLLPESLIGSVEFHSGIADNIEKPGTGGDPAIACAGG